MKRIAIDTPAPVADEPSVRDRMDRCHTELVLVRRALDGAQQSNRRLADAYAELDERYTTVTRLFVAMDALYDAQDECSALRALSEIMINLAGTEEFGIYEIGAGQPHPVIYSFGLDDGRAGPLVPSGPVAAALTAGRAWLRDSPQATSPEGEPIACIPFRIGERVAFAVVIWSFLPQKRSFEAFDVELYALLAHRAAPAIRAARLVEAVA